MTKSLIAIGSLVAVLLEAAPARAQAGTTSTDSLRHYELSEVVVGGETANGREVQVGAVRRVPLALIVRADMPSVAGLARLIASAHVQTNSRGESLIYLRNGGERQVGIFLDGALLNIPWDNRVDLDAVPASILGGLRVTHGAGSVLFGTNVLGGVVSLASRSLDREGSISEVTLSSGSAGSARVDAMHINRRGRQTVLAAAGFSRDSGMPVSGDADLPFARPGEEIRANTDQRLAHGFLRWSREAGRSLVGLSLLHVDAEKGVAAEAHLDPSAERVRYWRYPEKRTTMLLANLAISLGAGFTLRGGGWATAFRQEIEQFSSESYSNLEERQKDQDDTAGFRLVAEHRSDRGSWRGALNGMASTHRQQEFQQAEAGFVSGPLARYRQATWSLGSEYEVRIGSQALAVVGVNFDRMSTPNTADKPPRGATNAWGATATLDTELKNGFEVHSTMVRKVRFPTMRELFGTALSRFLINADLAPESAWLLDAGLIKNWDAGHVEVTAFLNRTDDTIDQRNVTLNGKQLRQRVNLSGSRVTGLEIVGSLNPIEALTLDGAATLTNPVVVGDPERSVLTEKPEVLASASVTFKSRKRSSYTLESVYTGRAFGLMPDNTLQALPRVLQINARASVRHFTSKGLFAEAFFRVNNITDRAVVPQLGLPGPGRQLQLGLSLAV